VDQSTVNQIAELPHRLRAIKVDKEKDLAEASPLGLFRIALDITACSPCEDMDEPSAGSTNHE
jgi:hypothetical protein